MHACIKSIIIILLLLCFYAVYLWHISFSLLFKGMMLSLTALKHIIILCMGITLWCRDYTYSCLTLYTELETVVYVYIVCRYDYQSEKSSKHFAVVDKLWYRYYNYVTLRLWDTKSINAYRLRKYYTVCLKFSRLKNSAGQSMAAIFFSCEIFKVIVDARWGWKLDHKNFICKILILSRIGKTMKFLPLENLSYTVPSKHPFLASKLCKEDY